MRVKLSTSLKLVGICHVHHQEADDGNRHIVAQTRDTRAYILDFISNNAHLRTNVVGYYLVFT